jgi:hypothetical protein
MDEQKKIKILKSFDYGLQKPFSKNKEERFIKTFGSLRAFGPLSDPLYQITFSPLLKKRKI